MGIKTFTEDLVRLNDIEENVLRKRANIDWLKLGDGNNYYFHASLKTKDNARCMNPLHTDDGVMVTSQQDIEEVVLTYYGKLMGQCNNNLTHIDVPSIREGCE